MHLKVIVQVSPMILEISPVLRICNHKTRPPPTVNYTKNMPDIESLMQEWPPEMEQAFKATPFPGPEIDMHVSDYAKIICAMSDIPVHKL